MDHALDADFCTRKCTRRTAIRAHRPMGPSGICQGAVEARPVCVCGQRSPLLSATCCPQRTGMAVLKNGHPNVVTELPGGITSFLANSVSPGRPGCALPKHQVS